MAFVESLHLLQLGFQIIKKVAEEQKFDIEGAANKTTFQIYIARWHAVAFQLKVNDSGYVQAHQWECDKDGENGRYGRGIYSIRSFSDCVAFCSILIASAAIRAGRE